MKNKYYLYTILATLLSISCQKFGHHLALETGTLTNKTASGAQVDAMVIDVGESGLTEHGWCIATEPEPTVSNTKINNGSKSQYGVYNNEITGLDPASKYYIRPYITNDSQTVYGEQLELQTEALQFTINTPVANTIWAKGKTFSINWAANINDKINIDLYKDGTLVKSIVQGIENTGSYNWPITNELENGEEYKIIITSSENEIIKAETALFSIYDNAPPGVSTEEANNISYFIAQIGGTLVHFGTEESVLQHGHCWSKNENPTIDDNKTELGAKSTLETFTSDLSELEDNTKYYVRAYAVSEEGVAYSQQQEFITLMTEAPKLSSPIINNISYTNATFLAEVKEQGTHNMVSRGVCWSKMENPTINDDKIEENSGIGSFTKDLNELDWNTQYHVRAFAINEVDTAYSEQVSFTTLEALPPTVVTSEVTNISYTSATCGGEVTSEGTHDVISRGFCWSNSENPTVEDDKANHGIGVGIYSINIENLKINTNYYVKAFAISEVDTSYGEQRNFTTFDAILPIVATSEVSYIGYSSAICSGEVIDEGTHDVISRGICWNTTLNPTVDDHKVENGLGIGNFTCDIENLEDNTTYFIRAFATNLKGTSYGIEVSFTTKQRTGVFTDERDNQTYKWGRIGEQIWMSENLRATKYVDGTSIAHITDNNDWKNLLNTDKAYCWHYNDELSNKLLYGALYTWAAAMNGASSSNSNPSNIQGVCPNGWHLPSTSEWQQLITFIAEDGHMGSEGSALKSANGWVGNDNGNDSYGFTALAGAHRSSHEGWFGGDLGNFGLWWTSNGDNLLLQYDYEGFHLNSTSSKSNGLSIRCVKD